MSLKSFYFKGGEKKACEKERLKKQQERGKNLQGKKNIYTGTYVHIHT